jgi:transposase
MSGSRGLNRQAIAVSPLIKRQLAQRLRQIDGQIEAIDRRLKTLRNADSDLCQRFDILTSIPGVGEVTANVLVVETPELGRLEHAQAASLVGLAPVPRDSGQTHGKAIHPRRAPTSQTGSLHAHPQRHPIEP